MDTLGVKLEPNDRVPYEYGAAAARAALNSADSDLAWAEGQTLGLDEAISYAFSI